MGLPSGGRGRQPRRGLQSFWSLVFLVVLLFWSLGFYYMLVLMYCRKSKIIIPCYLYDIGNSFRLTFKYAGILSQKIKLLCKEWLGSTENSLDIYFCAFAYSLPVNPLLYTNVYIELCLLFHRTYLCLSPFQNVWCRKALWGFSLVLYFFRRLILISAGYTLFGCLHT